MASSESPRPNPGSDEALALGCICAIMDNNRGTRAPYPPDGWWITMGCPVHAPVHEDHPDTHPEWLDEGGSE